MDENLAFISFQCERTSKVRYVVSLSSQVPFENTVASQVMDSENYNDYRRRPHQVIVTKNL